MQVTYSISGIFWFAQLSLFAALLLVLLKPKEERCLNRNNNNNSSRASPSSSLFFCLGSGGGGRGGRRGPLCRTIGLLGVGVSLVLLLVDHLQTASEGGFDAAARNLWLGGVLPFSVGWSFREWHRYHVNAGTPHGVVRAHMILLLATPSLAVLSVTCLSLMFFYFPMVSPPPPVTSGKEADPFLVELLLNASRVYYEWVVSSSSNSFGMVALAAPRTVSDVATAMCALPVLWVALTMLVGCGLRIPSRACSTMGTYVLATLIVRLISSSSSQQQTEGNGLITVALMAVGILVCKASVCCLMHTELHHMERIAVQQGLTQANALTRCFSIASSDVEPGSGEEVGPLYEDGGPCDEE